MTSFQGGPFPGPFQMEAGDLSEALQQSSPPHSPLCAQVVAAAVYVETHGTRGLGLQGPFMAAVSPGPPDRGQHHAQAALGGVPDQEQSPCQLGSRRWPGWLRCSLVGATGEVRSCAGPGCQAGREDQDKERSTLVWKRAVDSVVLGRSTVPTDTADAAPVGRLPVLGKDLPGRKSQGEAAAGSCYSLEKLQGDGPPGLRLHTLAPELQLRVDGAMEHEVLAEAF